MSFEPLKNSDGADVYPSGAHLFVDKPGAIFDDTVYNALKTPTPTTEPAPTPIPEPAATGTSAEPAAAVGTSEPSSTSEPVPTPAIDYDAILKEKTGGKLEKWEDLLARLDKPAEEIKFTNEKSRKIFEHLREGKQDEVFDFLQKEKLLSNVDKMEDTDKVKLKLQLENPDWNIDDVEDEFNERYGVKVNESEVPAEVYAREKRKADRRLAVEVKASIDYINTLKGELDLPSLAPAATPSADPRVSQFESQVNELNEINTKFLASIDAQASQLGVIDLSVNDKDVQFTHTFEIPEADKPALIAAAKDYWAEFNRDYSKDGQWNTKELMEHIYIKRNLPSIIKSAVAKAMNEKQIATVRGIANVAVNPVPGQVIDTTAAAQRADKANYILR